MAGTFFSTWALWQKMTFVLGCAIVFTLCLGFSKLFYNRHRLRKYEKLADMANATPEKAAQIPLTEDVESSSVLKIPFGIRAIQSGIEIDGVWVSQPSTPTSNMSKESLVSPILRPQLPSSVSEPALLHPNSTGNSIRSSTMSSTASRSFSSETTTLTRHLGGSPASSIYSAPLKQDMRKLTTERGHLEALSETKIPRMSGSIARNGDPPKASQPQPRSTDQGGNSSDNFSDLDQGPRLEMTSHVRIRTSPDVRIGAANGAHRGSRGQSTSSMENDGDLGMLDRHRLSHVASTGQLTPRTSPHSRDSQRTDGTSSLRIKEDNIIQPLQTIISAENVEGNTFWRLMEEFSMNSGPPMDGPSRRFDNVSFGHGKDDAEVISQDASTRLKGPEVFRRVNSGFEIVRPGSIKKLDPTNFDEEEEGQALGRSRFSVRSLPRILQKKQRYDSLRR